ncbi:MAG TPA: hypothetical protein VM243_14425 [Phycisphaerae bacterium]|nr:hypothetical protein [Phycisphaerae bacterium]
MSRGRETKYAPKGSRQYAVPRREQILEHDYFYPCQRCGDPWPRTDLRREKSTGELVCLNDYDAPSREDVEVQDRDRLRRLNRGDRLRRRLQDLP